MARRTAVVTVAVLVTVVFVASFAAAQSGTGIAGVVRDTTGGVLPGVTVEASSPALLEKVRTVVTDSQGLYNVTDLRPGVYTVTFTMQGFRTVKREGVELISTFTATVNGEMPVGGLETALTVSGVSPVVDIQNVALEKVMTRQVVDALPVGSKQWGALAILVPGVRVTGAHNVGGTGSSNNTATLHGGSPEESVMMLDGMRYNQGSGIGGIRNVYSENDGSIEEITFGTGALSAEVEVGGFIRNIVPKEGGNDFKGFFAAAYTGRRLQSNNLDDDLRNRGVPFVNFVDKIWDINPAFGGRLVQDKLWFYAAFRSWGSNEGLAGVYFNKTPTGLSYTPDLNRPALGTIKRGSENLRLTWMATPKNKVGVYYEYQQNLENYNYGQGSTLGAGGITSPESIARYKVYPNYWVQARWSNPVSSRLLLTAGLTFANNDWKFNNQPGNPPDLPGITELRTNTTWRNRAGLILSQNSTRQFNYSGSMSYVTGSHSFKTGFLGLQSPSDTTREAPANGTALRFLDGVPNSVTVFATPYEIHEAMRQVGIFAEDHWKVRRLMLYLGVRFDYYNAWVPAQHLGPGPQVPTRNLDFAEVPDAPNWKDVSPRFGVGYDLFGTGKTVLKATFNRYLYGPESITFTRLANPVGALALSAIRNWTDANGDFVAQESELGPLSDRAFGSPNISTRYNPAVLSGGRGDNWEVTTTIQHELFKRVGIGAGYYRRWWGNFLDMQNQGVTSADFDPYSITAPVDPRLPGGGGYRIDGLYNVKPAKFGVTNNVITFANNFGKRSEVYDSVEFSINGRFPNGAFIGGGTNTERKRINTCHALNDLSLGGGDPRVVGVTFPTGAPRTQAFCDIRPPFQTHVKLYGAYPLPWWGLQASATLQSLPPPEISASYTARNAEIAPTLGRPLSGGANATAVVQLIPPGTMYGERLNQVDFRLAKTFTVGRARIQPQFDLYNLFNGNAVIGQNTTYGPQWLRPTVVLLGRFAKFGMQIDF